MNLGLDTDSEDSEDEKEVASPMKDTPEKSAKDREVEARLDETLMRKPKPVKAQTKKKKTKLARPPSGWTLNKLKEEEKVGSQKDIMKSYSKQILGEQGSKTLTGFKKPKQNFLKKRTLRPLNGSRASEISSRHSDFEGESFENQDLKMNTMTDFTKRKTESKKLRSDILKLNQPHSLAA